MIDIGKLSQDAQEALGTKYAAREQALPKSRATIRHCANAIRAAHRGDFATTVKLIAAARTLLEEMQSDLRGHPDVLYAGFVADAQKEVTEAAALAAIIQGQPLPMPVDLGVEWAPYLNGLGETVGELRRHVLDELRHSHFEQCEALLTAMDEILSVLVALDFPDAITNNLRRTTDTARNIIEKTRGDLTIAAIQTQFVAEVTQLTNRVTAATTSTVA